MTTTKIRNGYYKAEFENRLFVIYQRERYGVKTDWIVVDAYKRDGKIYRLNDINLYPSSFKTLKAAKIWFNYRLENKSI